MEDAIELLKDIPATGNKSYFKITTGNPGYQAGATKAMGDAIQNRWFDGYDWVVRTNPDVILYDTRPLEYLLQKNGTWGVFANCKRSPPRSVDKKSGKVSAKIHTDFFAVKPDAIGPDLFGLSTVDSVFGFRASSMNSNNSERTATSSFSHILTKDKAAWLLPVRKDRQCRIAGAGVLHDHNRTLQSSCQKGIIPYPVIEDILQKHVEAQPAGTYSHYIRADAPPQDIWGLRRM